MEEPRNMLKLALLAHNKIRETHIDTESLTLAPDLSTNAQEYAEQLRLVQTFLLRRRFFYFMKNYVFCDRPMLRKQIVSIKVETRNRDMHTMFFGPSQKSTRPNCGENIYFGRHENFTWVTHNKSSKIENFKIFVFVRFQKFLERRRNFSL